MDLAALVVGGVSMKVFLWFPFLLLKTEKYLIL